MLSAAAGAEEEEQEQFTVLPPPPPPLLPRTRWTRRVPHPVLIGHAACLVQVGDTCVTGDASGALSLHRFPCLNAGAAASRVYRAHAGGVARVVFTRGDRHVVSGGLSDHVLTPPPAIPVLNGHVSSLLPY